MNLYELIPTLGRNEKEHFRDECYLMLEAVNALLAEHNVEQPEWVQQLEFVLEATENELNKEGAK